MYSSCGCVPQVCISAKFSVNSEICTVWSHCRINPSQTSTRDFFYVFPPWCFPVGFCYQTSPWDCRCAPVWTAQLRAAEDLGISSHILSGSSLVLFHSPITSTVRLCQWSLLLPALIRINPSWCQQAWGCIGCYIVKKPQSLTVTPAMKPCINRLSPSVSSSVVAFNWKYKGECNSPRLLTVMQQRAPSKHQTHLSVWVFKPQHWPKPTLINVLILIHFTLH